MSEERIQRAVSVDGTEIAGRVLGQGPPLVLVHGGWGDGEVAWEALLPHLTDRFTCYLPSTRGRDCPGIVRTTRTHASKKTSQRSLTASASRFTWSAGRASRERWVLLPTVTPSRRWLSTSPA